MSLLDLRGFTAFAETAAPEELFDVLREYHAALGELIPAHEGTLEHFAGDGVMVFFNDPLAVADHELQAVRFAVAAQERFASWMRSGVSAESSSGWVSGSKPATRRSGESGSKDATTTAPRTGGEPRLALSTQAAAGQILIGQRLFAAVEEMVETAPAGNLELKGFARPVAAYEILGFLEATVPNSLTELLHGPYARPAPPSSSRPRFWANCCAGSHIGHLIIVLQASWWCLCRHFGGFP